VLQEGEFFKLGTQKPRKVDVRFVAATNADLESLLAQGLFRKDFYYRLRGAWLHLPPLRERKEDIPRLAKKFLEEFTPVPRDREVDGQTLNLLLAYDYPGNIRELKSILQAAVNLAKGRQLSSHLLPKFFREKISAKELARQSASPEPIMPLAAMEKNYILNVYRQTGRNKSRTALLLGLGLNTLRRKLQSYGEE
jgi:transcriptional regulator with PAS, ATPase and Fis domain